MIVISRTPLRISLFGGGTDYPIYYYRKPGIVLGTTINQYIYVSVKKRNLLSNHRYHLSYSTIESAQYIHEIKHPSIRECLTFMKIEDPLEIHIFSDLPAKTGLGSSSAFTVGLLNALSCFRGDPVTNQYLAEQACFVEQQKIQENVGSQDQFHAAYGGLNVIHLHKQSIRVEPLNLELNRMKLLEKELLVFYTGLTRFASDVLEEQIQKTQTLSNDLALQEMYELSKEAISILKEEPEESMVKKFAQTLHQSWVLKKRLSSKISNHSIDTYYQLAINAGAYGGKLCGAGSGGFLIFFAPLEKHSDICAVLKDLPKINVEFDRTGSQVIYKQGL